MAPVCRFRTVDVLMFAEFGSLYKIRITLDDAAYHEVDSSESASARQVGMQAAGLSKR